MGKFIDYESSNITPQMTLLQQLNEIKKYLRLNEFTFGKNLGVNFEDNLELIGRFFSSDGSSKIIRFSTESVNSLTFSDNIVFTLENQSSSQKLKVEFSNGSCVLVLDKTNSKFDLGFFTHQVLIDTEHSMIFIPLTNSLINISKYE